VPWDVTGDPGLTNIRQFMNCAHDNDGYPAPAPNNPLLLKSVELLTTGGLRV